MSTATNAVCLITVLTASLSVRFEKLWCSLRAFALVFYRILQPNHGSMQSFSRKTACAYGKYEQEIGFSFSEPEETGRKNATLQQENVKLRTELSKQERLNNTKRGSKPKRTESNLEVPVDLRVGLRTYFVALMLEEKLFIVRD